MVRYNFKEIIKKFNNKTKSETLKYSWKLFKLKVKLPRMEYLHLQFWKNQTLFCAEN